MTHDTPVSERFIDLHAAATSMVARCDSTKTIFKKKTTDARNLIHRRLTDLKILKLNSNSKFKLTDLKIL
jgi:hypothetical protein